MNGSLPRPRRWVLALTFLAAALQWWALDAQSLWYDEGFSVWLAEKPVGEIVARTAADIHPPLYYLLLHGWISLTGRSEWTLRFLSAGFAVLAVPLMWQVARRLLCQPRAADAAALLVALSPLWLWYGREARMYTLALALLLAAALALLPLLRAGQPAAGGRWWGRVAAFALLATLAAYTHFYVWFVLAGWALAAVLERLRHPRAVGSRPGMLAFALPLLAYLPWLGVTVQRLGADRSYWSGTLALGRAVESGLASWMVGHTMSEAAALPLGLVGGGLALAGGATLAWRVAAPRASMLLAKRPPDAPLPLVHLLFTLFWLVVPIVGLLALSWNRPKFHPRYLIFAAPAWTLLLGALLGWLWGRKWAGKGVAALLTVGLVAVSLVADANLYRDPAFAKTDWRGLAAFLREARQPDEPILLVSGHAFPVFHYYFPAAENVVRLPDRPTLDTEAVLGLTTAAALAEPLAAARGAWVVNWQDEVVDPEGIVPALLRAAGGQSSPAPRFMDLRLSHWTLPPNAPLARALEPANPLAARFGGALQLLGWSGLPGAQPADQGLSLVLYWAAERPLADDLKVRLSVVDASGFEVGTLDQRPTSYNFPTFRWQPGEPRLATLAVPLEPGTPPGDYWLHVSVYAEGSAANLDVLDAAGQPQGQTVRLGPIAVGPAAIGWLGATTPPDAAPVNATLLDDTRLLAARLALPTSLEPGQSIPVTLWWRAAGPLPGATLHLGWESAAGLVESVAQPVAGAGWPGEAWRPGDLLRTPLAVRVPRDLPPGATQLVAWLSDAAGRQSERVPLGAGEVVAAPRSFEPPAVATPQEATFGDAIRLLGYDLVGRAAPGATLTLTLHWQALGEMDASLTTFVHLLDANSVLIPGAGQDRLPLDGTRQTPSWLAGEFLSDPFSLTLPPDAPPGPYIIEVGWYDAADPAFPRLPAAGQGADQNRVLIPVP